jgi:succinoglycan biosynthesis transport protein ExoP
MTTDATPTGPDGPRSTLKRELAASAREQRPPRAGAGAPGEAEGGASTIHNTVQRGLAFAKRQWLLLAAGIGLGVLIAPFGFVSKPPSFMATASIMVDTGRVQLFQAPGVVGETPIDSSAALESQLAILRSSRVAQKVMDRLNLRAEPEFQVGERGRAARLLGADLARFLGRDPIRTEARRERFRLEVFAAGLTVRRIPGTFAVDLTYSADVPERAAQIANAVADAYLEVLIEMKQDVTRRAGSWLQTRIEELRDQLAAAQQAVNDFKARHSLMSTGGQQLVEKRIGELSTQLASAQVLVREAQVKLHRIDVAVAEYARSTTKPALPEQMSNPLVTRLREQLFELSNREAEWGQRFGKGHQAVEKLRGRMAEIHVALLEEMRRLAESYRSELEIALQRQGAVERELRATELQLREAETAGIKLRELESTAKSYETLYDGFMRRHGETAEQETFPIPRARIINRATEPLSKDLKKPFQMALVFFALGIGAGLAGAMLREVRDRSFRSLADVTGTLGKRVLALVPIWSADADAQIPDAARAPADHERRTVSRLDARHFAVQLAPQTGYASAMRSISQQIEKLRTSKGSLVVGVTSPEPNQGSSTMSAGLAAASAAAGLKVLLIDADMRNPSLTRSLAPMATTTLLDVLNGAAKLDEALWSDKHAGFQYLPGAPDRPHPSADEMLASNRMRELIAAAQERFDLVILDLPPLVPMTDVVMTTDFVTAYLAVVRWGVTHKEPTRHALEMYPALAGKIMGVILNQVDTERLPLYDPLAARWFDQRLYKSYLIRPRAAAA